MKIQTVQKWVSLGLGVLWTASVGVSTARADRALQPRPTVRISVYNDAGLKRGTLLHAEEDAAEVFRHAGIETEWKNCGGEKVVLLADKRCGEAEYPTRLVLRIERQPRGVTPEAFGVAYLSPNGQGAYCHIFVEPIEELQQHHFLRLDVVLGHVAAHEIGHLLLGLNSHSANGLMKAHWSLQTLEELKRKVLGFNSAQSAAMVERLETAQATAKDTLVTMAEAAPVELSAVSAQCPDSH